MSDIKLFRLNGHTTEELPSTSVALERSLQTLIERHLDTFLGITFLASEYSTGRVHGGRIDTLGIDENGCPVIIEYKRASNQNVINQGLFYLDWLMDHQAEFQLLVMKTCDQEAAETIEWSSPRLLCIASDFTRYDEHAIQQINRNIELIRYRKYGDELLLFELVNATTTTTTPATVTGTTRAAGEISVTADIDPSGDAHPTEAQKAEKAYAPAGSPTQAQSIADYIDRSSPKLLDLYTAMTDYITSLGDDVQMKQLRWYIAFRRLKNFACLKVHPAKDELVVFVKVDPDEIELEEGFSRDVRAVQDLGSLELRITSKEDMEKAKPLIEQSYEAN
jgi:predicted transport protein